MRPAEELAAYAEQRAMKQKALAEKLERARKHLGVLTDAVIAQRFNVSTKMVSSWRKQLGIAGAKPGAGE